MQIQRLSKKIINKISAGEVIRRPVSIVKELIENAIDAKATHIDITLEYAGKNLIIVQDNGTGMSKNNLELAIQRYTTSKINQEGNLLNIKSFGFRGEALASICTVSKCSITSQVSGCQNSYTLSIIGGNVIESKVSSCIHTGTIVEVRDLFFSTPAKLKFLGTDKTELNAIIKYVKKILLAHPKISCKLTHNNRRLITIQKHLRSNNIHDRIVNIIGAKFIKHAIEVSYTHDNIIIYGYTALPTYNKLKAGAKYFFINNRPVQDKVLNTALKRAYQKCIGSIQYHTSILFLFIPPEQIDVNIHPTKNEVRFYDPYIIQEMVITAVSNAFHNMCYYNNKILSGTLISSINHTGYHQYYNAHHTKYNIQNMQFSMNYCKQTISTMINGRNIIIPSAQLEILSMIDYIPQYVVQQKHSPILHSTTNPSFETTKIQINKHYVIAQQQSKEKIIIADIKAAHKLIGYKKISEQINNNTLIKQKLSNPELIELPDESTTEILNKNKTNLSILGLTIEKYDNTSVMVLEIPKMLNCIDISSLILYLAEYCMLLPQRISFIKLKKYITASYSYHYAIMKSMTQLQNHEINNILQEITDTLRLAVECVHNQQIYIELTEKDIQKLLKKRC